VGVYRKKELVFGRAHDERSEKLPDAFGLGVAADNKFLFLEQFKFDPSATSLPNLINRILPFTDESLPTKFPRLFKKWLRVISQSPGIANYARGLC
jgi:hypothetical protein